MTMKPGASFDRTTVLPSFSDSATVSVSVASEVETPQAFEEDVRRELRGVRRLVEGVEKEPEGTLAAAPLIELRSGEQSVDREATLAIGAQASHRDPTPTS